MNTVVSVPVAVARIMMNDKSSGKEFRWMIVVQLLGEMRVGWTSALVVVYFLTCV